MRALRLALSYLVEDVEQLQKGQRGRREHIPDRTELLIVDEADRLKVLGLEQIRDIYDQGRIGIILIGMPELEERLVRYPQLASRVGFVHQFGRLSPDETLPILETQWCRWGLTLQSGKLEDVETIAAIVRITGGNFQII